MYLMAFGIAGLYIYMYTHIISYHIYIYTYYVCIYPCMCHTSRNSLLNWPKWLSRICTESSLQSGSMILKPADLSTIKKWHLKHVLSRSSWFTPWKINMEPTNHPFRKENDLPNLHDYVPCWSSGVYHLFSCFAEVPNFQTSFNTIPIQNINKNIHKTTKKKNLTTFAKLQKNETALAHPEGCFFQGCVNHDWHAVI